MNNTSNYEEDMEIDEIEEIRKVRRQFAINGNMSDINFPKDCCSKLSSVGKKVFVIVDTNIFLNGNNFFNDIFSSSKSDSLTLVIPWAVIQEIDHFKNIRNSKNIPKLKTLMNEAINCVQMFNSWLKTKKSNIFFQTSADSNKTIPEIKIESNDDKILQCCIQIKKSSFNILALYLLTEDKHLRNKAMILEIDVFNKKDFIKFFEKFVPASPKPLIYSQNVTTQSQFLDFQKPQNNYTPEKFEWNDSRNNACSINLIQSDMMDLDYERNNEFNNQIFDSNNTSNKKSDLQKKVKDINEDIIRTEMSMLLKMELQRVYSALWESVVFIEPPWKNVDVLKCFRKHWMALFSDMWPRKFSEEVDHIINLYKNQEIDCEFTIYITLENFINNMNPDNGNINYKKYIKLKNKMITKLQVIKSELKALKIIPKKKSKKGKKNMDIQKKKFYTSDEVNNNNLSIQLKTGNTNSTNFLSNSVKNSSSTQMDLNVNLSSKINNFEAHIIKNTNYVNQLHKSDNFSIMENINKYSSSNINQWNNKSTNALTTNSYSPTTLLKGIKRKLQEESRYCQNIEKNSNAIVDNSIACNVTHANEYIPICKPLNFDPTNFISSDSKHNSISIEIESLNSDDDNVEKEKFEDEIMFKDSISSYLDIIWNSIINDGKQMLEVLKNCGPLIEIELVYNFCAAVNKLVIAAHNYSQKRLISENELKTFCNYLTTFHFKYTNKMNDDLTNDHIKRYFEIYENINRLESGAIVLQHLVASLTSQINIDPSNL